MTNNFEGWIQDYGDYPEGSDKLYNESNDISQKEWDIKTLPPNPEVDESKFSSERKDLDDVEIATCLEDALTAYGIHYSWDEINLGKQSPQFAAKMLIRIKDKFNDQMNYDQRQGVASEIIAMCHAIGHLTQRPPEAGGDRTSLEGLIEISEAISQAQIYATDEIPLLEQDLRDVAARVESRVAKEESPLVKPLSGSLLAALDEFENLSSLEKEAIPFPKIVGKIERDNLNQAENQVAALNRKRSRSPQGSSQGTRYNTEIAQVTQTNYPTSVATLVRRVINKRRK